MSTDLNELKRYVQNAPKRSLSAGTVSLNITHNLISNNFQEIIFSLDSTVLALKEKIHGLTGSQVYAMDLYLDGKLISSDESNHDKKIGYFSPQLSSTLHVVDTDPFSLAKNRAFDDTSLVKKFTLTDEEYGKRKNTYRAYKEQQIAQNPNWKSIFQQKSEQAQAARKQENTSEEESLESIMSRIQVGARCCIFPGDRLATVKYVGPVPELPCSEGRTWIGVEYDLPLGKNDGSYGEKRYFNAKPGYGGFCSPSIIKVGEYPEEDPFADEL